MSITTIRDRLGFSFPPGDVGSASALPAKSIGVNPRRRALFNEQNGICHYCQKPTPFAAWTIDHITPASRGGRGSKNMVGACCKCNSAKGDLTADEFRKVQAGEPRPPTSAIKVTAPKKVQAAIRKIVAVRPSPIFETVTPGDMRETRLRVFKARTSLDWQHYTRKEVNGKIRPLSHALCRKVYRKYDKRKAAAYPSVANPFTD